jgi:oligopeptide/dipeptide ABC transporter ATP-binding protein
MDYPFQFSGGMCQRVAIAMGIANKPDLLIADEPTSALDVTVQSQIIELLKHVRYQYGMAILLITHDLAVAAQICTQIMVMYAGRIVEKASVKSFYQNPAHPYSKGLIRSIPMIDRDVDRLPAIDGQPPSLLNQIPGCRFASRCQQAMPLCQKSYPPEIQIKNEGSHYVACWLHD